MLAYTKDNKVIHIKNALPKQTIFVQIVVEG